MLHLLDGKILLGNLLASAAGRQEKGKELIYFWQSK